jgi:hypothetical protein
VGATVIPAPLIYYQPCLSLSLHFICVADTGLPIIAQDDGGVGVEPIQRRDYVEGSLVYRILIILPRGLQQSERRHGSA